MNPIYNMQKNGIIAFSNLFIQMGSFISRWCFTASIDSLTRVYDVIYTDAVAALF